MAQLVIKGHHTRGNEVIALLEMLGGKNTYKLKGDEKYAYYTIDRDNEIRGGLYIYGDDESENIVSFTLEIFEDKFPYKVGDKVETIYGKIGIVKQLIWSNKDNAVRYELEADRDSLYFANELQSYKEETMEGVYAYNEINCYHQDFGDKVRIRLGNDFEIKVEDNITYIVKKQPKYPKTFIEVLDFWHPDRQLEDDYQSCYKKDLIEKFQDLLYARDAYWKIAGDELGLGKSWEPEFRFGKKKYSIMTKDNKVINATVEETNRILVFPTEEMRAAFYENFKDLIEKCKELL